MTKGVMAHIDLSSILYVKARIISGTLESENRFELNEQDYADMINILVDYFVKIRDHYGATVLIHQDGYRHNIWRREIHSDYKRHRKYEKPKTDLQSMLYDVARKGMFKVIDDVIERCKIYGIIPVKFDKLEADDTIYLAVKRWHKEYNHFIISKDGDLLQIKMYYPNVRVMKDINVEHSYEMLQNKIFKKIVAGDRKDGVHHIASRISVTPGFGEWIKNIYLQQGTVVDDVHDLVMNQMDTPTLHKLQDLYFEKSGANPIAKKNAKTFKSELYTKSLIDIGDDIQKGCESWIFNNFELNKKLILFTYIPQHLQEKIYEVSLEPMESSLAMFAGIL